MIKKLIWSERGLWLSMVIAGILMVYAAGIENGKLKSRVWTAEATIDSWQDKYIFIPKGGNVQ